MNNPRRLVGGLEENREMKRIYTIILAALLGTPFVLSAQDNKPVPSARMLQLQDSLVKDERQQEKIKKQLADKINTLAEMMREFDDASASMNGISGLGRIEQMQFKAERYSAERQVRKQIEKEVINLAGLVQEMQNYDEKIKEWRRLIDQERSIQELKNTLAAEEKPEKEKRTYLLYHNNGKPLVRRKEGHKKLLKAAAQELGFKKLDKKARRKLREHLHKAAEEAKAAETKVCQ
jgi:hypothetical protein